MAGGHMRFTSVREKSESNKARYTNLFACISEEEDSFTVQVRLFSRGRPDSAAWGEEIADSLETASMLVTAIAAEFSIVQAGIELEIRMLDARSGTRH
jgi:hypothetical protein